MRKLSRRVAEETLDIAEPVERAGDKIPFPHHVGDGLGGETEALLALTQGFLGALALGHVTQDAHGVPRVVDLDTGEGHGHRDLPAILVQGVQFQRLADRLAASGALELRERLVVCAAIALRCQKLVQILPKRLARRVSEQALGRRIPEGHAPLRVHHQDGVLGRVRDAVQDGFPLPQRLVGLCAFRDLA